MLQAGPPSLHYYCAVVNDLGKILTLFCSTCFLSLYDEVTNVLCVSLKQRITTAFASVDRLCSGLFGQN
jgi:hypothetical protein